MKIKLEIEEIFNRPIDKVLYKNSVLRTLTDDEIKRMDKLVKILKNLESGKTVQNRQLEVWLSPNQYTAIHTDWQNELQSRKDHYGEKPDSLIEYERRLNEALFAFNRADSYSSKGNTRSAKKLHHKAERLFEDALEFLEVEIGKDMSLSHWLDRNIDSSHLSHCPAGMPRLRTSRSLENRSKINRKSIRECKISAVRSAIAEICYENRVNELGHNKSKVNSILNSLDNEEYD